MLVPSLATRLTKSSTPSSCSAPAPTLAPDVTIVQPGKRVTVEPDLPCWACKQCRAGRENLCENLGFFGCGSEQGGMADLFTIDARRVHPVPEDLDDATAALIEPLATPVHAARSGSDSRSGSASSASSR